MTNTKAFILVGVVLATAVFVVFGIREVKKNEKKSFGEQRNSQPDQFVKEEFTFQEIVNEAKNKPQ